MNQSQQTWEPQPVQDYFLGITKLPHPSANQKGVTGNEDPVRQYVVDEALKISNVDVVFYKKDATEPGERVVVLRRNGSGKYAGKKPVILQAHLDMVYNPADMKFPLNVVRDTGHTDGKWIKAQDQQNRPSTLGADDGIGAATALAILADSRFKDYPIECLFTVQEETDMGGAQNCNVKNLTGDKLLNLDAEVLEEIIFGSAGGAETNYKANLSRSDCPTDYVTKKLSISALRGGHSGIDINKGRLNAIKALGQTLLRLDKRTTNLDVQGTGIKSYDILLSEFKRTDILKANAIPAGAEAIVVIPKDQADNFERDFRAYCELLKSQYLPIENNFTFNVSSVNSSLQPLDEKCTDSILCIIQQIPSGVVSMIPGVPEVVETSSNLYNVELTDTNVLIASSNRSSNERFLDKLNALQVNIGNIFNFNVEAGIDRYVSWQPNYSSAVLEKTCQVYNELYRGDYNKTVIHAGLECGVLAGRFEKEMGVKLDCVSIGPTIRNPHTGNECLQIETADGVQPVQQFYNAVCQTLTQIFNS